MNTAGAKRVAVLGGGISGLAAAHRLHELCPSLEVELLEAESRLGGVLQTHREHGLLVEYGADNFITNVPWAVDFCRRIGIEDQLIETNPAHRRAFVVRKGRLRPIPQGFVVMAPSRLWPIVATPILSPLGKLRLVAEMFIRKGTTETDESLASFAIRRFGRETYERLVQPLVGGIYTGDPHRLSLRSTLPRFLEMEKKHGSLFRALWRQAPSERPSASSGSGARYSMFVAPRDGMSGLIDAVAARLPVGAVKLNSPVVQMRRGDDGRWALLIGETTTEPRLYDAVIVATPAAVTARLLKTVDDPLAGELAEIPYAGCSIVSVVYLREQIHHPLDGLGFVVPLIEGRKILSGSFSSIKYAGRAPEGKVLIRVFIGGACQPELAELPDGRLREIAASELAELLDIKGDPVASFISRRPGSMPQYHVGHEERLARIDRRAARLPGLFLAGNAYHGVGMPLCIHSGEQAAEKAVAMLAAERTAST